MQKAMDFAASTDTIAALATPPGKGGVAIVRISGPRAGSILSDLFRPAGSSGSVGSARPNSFIPRHLHYGHCLDSDREILDEALAVIMPAPHSFTGEDVAEIHCHGGPGITSALLESCVLAGARLAGPGEFTRRAFLNGRLDLTRAEAINEIINASTREGVRLAQAKLDGLLARKISEIRSSLDALRAQVILAVDFPDEEAELLDDSGFYAQLEGCRASLQGLLAGYRRARLWREGPLVVLAGQVNAGKSSLLNALLGRDRAIVSDLPGTTRDYLEESISLGGMHVRITDTAGLRESVDLIESEGMERSRTLAAEADLLVLVHTAGQPFQPEEKEFLRMYAEEASQGKLVLALNKIDLLEERNLQEYVRAMHALCADLPAFKAPVKPPVFCLSAKNGEGLEELSEGIRKAITGLPSAMEAGQGDLAPNIRQARLIDLALGEVGSLLEQPDLPADLKSVHLESAVNALREVTGSTGTDELLDRIFAAFCIGK